MQFNRKIAPVLGGQKSCIRPSSNEQNSHTNNDWEVGGHDTRADMANNLLQLVQQRAIYSAKTAAQE